MLRFPPVKTKADFVKRYAASEFGNASVTWRDRDQFFKEAKRSGQLFHLRNKIASGASYYNLDWSQTLANWIKAENPDQWFVSEMAPHHLNLIQGEVYQTEKGLSLFYSTQNNKPMRDVLRESPRTAHGIMVKEILRYYLCHRSFDWLYVLLERYPGHVVEFSTFDKCWGTIPGYNSVFWEVRDY